MDEVSVLKRTVPTLLFLGVFYLFIVSTSAAPFQSALRLPRDKGCYYLMKHYSNGERIETNEPCLNCTCVNSMLMCYLRICPFTKPVGPECVIKREEGECCPSVWCPGDEVPTPPPTEVPTTPEPLSCFAGGEAYVDGAQLPRNPDNPCEVCYCIRNSTACVMQECELKVEGCSPVYREPSCCPSRYNCSRYVATTSPPGPTPTVTPAGCLVNNHLYADGERIVSDNPCNHCYCMRDNVACAVEQCHAPGDGCIPQTIPEGQCCPDRYDCQGMEVAATDITTDEPHTTTPTSAHPEHDVTEKIDTTDKETSEPSLASDDVKITTSLPEEPEEIKISSTPQEKYATEKATTVSEKETTVKATTVSEETATPVKFAEETIQPVTLPTEEGVSTVSTTSKEENVTSSSPPEIISTVISELSSTPHDTKIPSTSTPASTKAIELTDLTSTQEAIESTASSTAKIPEDHVESVYTEISEESTTARDVLSPKHPSEQFTSTPHDIASTAASVHLETSPEVAEQEVKLTAGMEEEDKVTQMVTVFPEKTEISEITTPTPKLEEAPTKPEDQEYTEKKLIPEEETFTSASSIPTELKVETTQATKDFTTEVEASATKTTTTMRPILPGSIPGEGNCDYATGTYQNGEPVVPVHPCEKFCVCNNSVVACEMIQCEPILEDDPNCRIVKKPDQCCPYYECAPTTDHVPPPALNQTKEVEIPQKPIPLTTEAELPEGVATYGPSTAEPTELSTTKEEISTTKEYKEESASPSTVEPITEVETRVTETSVSTTPERIEVTGGDIATKDGEEVKTVSSSEIPSETSELPEMVETKSSTEYKPEEVSTISGETGKVTTGLPIQTEMTEATFTESAKEVTEEKVTEATEGTTEEVVKMTTKEATTEAEITSETQTQASSRQTTTEPRTEVVTTRIPESTETLELIGDTKPAVQITDHTQVPEVSSTEEERLPEPTSITEDELLAKGVDTKDVTEHLITEEKDLVSKEGAEVTGIASLEKVTLVDEKTTTTETVLLLDSSTPLSVEGQTERATSLMGQTTEETKVTPGTTEETVQHIADVTSETSERQESTTKAEVITVEPISREGTSDVVHSTPLFEATIEDKAKSDLGTDISQETTPTLMERTVTTEIAQPSDKIPESTTLGEVSSETATELTEEKTKVPLEITTTMRPLTDITKEVPEGTLAEVLGMTQAAIEVKPTISDTPTTQSTAVHEEITSVTEHEKSTTDQITTTERLDSSLPSEIDDKKTISTISPVETGEPEATVLKEFTEVEGIVTKHTVDYDKTTSGTSQSLPVTVTSPTTITDEKSQTSSVPLPKPTAIETEIKVQPDTKPLLTEIVVGRYTTVEPPTTSDFTFPVEVITGSSPEIQDQITGKVSLTSAKTTETTTSSKQTIPITEQATSTEMEKILSTTEVSESPYVQEDLKTTGIQIEEETIPSKPSAEASVTTTTKEPTVTVTPKISAVPEVTTVDVEGASTESTAKHIKTSFAPTDEDIATTTVEERETSTKARPDIEDKVTEMKRTTEETSVAPETTSASILLPEEIKHEEVETTSIATTVAKHLTESEIPESTTPEQIATVAERIRTSSDFPLTTKSEDLPGNKTYSILEETVKGITETPSTELPKEEVTTHSLEGTEEIESSTSSKLPASVSLSEEVTSHATEGTTTVREASSETPITRQTTYKTEQTTLEETTEKTPIHKVPDVIEGTTQFIPLEREVQKVDKSTPATTFDTESETPRGLDETPAAVSTDTSIEQKQKPEETTSIPPSEEHTTAEPLHEEVSIVTAATTEPSTEATQRTDVEHISTTEKSMTESTSAPSTEELLEITMEVTSEKAEEIHTTLSERGETTTFAKEESFDLTAETERHTSTTPKEIETKQPEEERRAEDSETLTPELSTRYVGVTETQPVTSTQHVTEVPVSTTEKEVEKVSTKADTSLAEAELTSTETHLQPEVPSEEPVTKDIKDISELPVTDVPLFTREESETSVPFKRTEAISSQTPSHTEVPFVKPHEEETSTQPTEDGIKLTTVAESVASSTRIQEIDLESTTETHKQPEVPSETTYEQDTTIKLETAKPSVEPITQSTIIHEETERTADREMEVTAGSTEAEESTMRPLVTEQLPIEKGTESIGKVYTDTVTSIPTELTSLFEEGGTPLFTLLSTAQTILEKETTVTTGVSKQDIEASKETATTTKLPPKEEVQETTMSTSLPPWLSSSAPTKHTETTSEKYTELPATAKSTTSPTPESTDDSEEPIFVQKGACVFNGIVYQSAEQIPRTDACEFCFCFRGDIICLHQGCPPPMTLCYEREVPGFCCPHYVCHSPKPLYNVSDHSTRKGRVWKRSAEVTGCEANGEVYKVGEIMHRYSSPCLKCKCDPNGSMTCEPQKCKPQEPLLLKLNKAFFQKKH